MPTNVITSTGFSLPLAVISSNGFIDPNNILLPDGDFAQSVDGADIVIGNFDFLNGGIPNNAVITGFELQIVGKAGAQTVPPLTLTIYAIDNTSGTDLFYPYTTPFTGLTPVNASHILGTQNYVFATAWTADQAQNFKLQLVANGDLYLDTVLINVYYYIPSPTPTPTPTPSACIDCDSPIQVQTMSLELPFLVNETKFYLKKGSFAYADGTPVQPGDVGTCGGSIDFVFDPAKRKQAGSNFAENVRLDTSVASWIVLPSGVIEVDITNVTYRGLKFHTPYDHDATLMSNHDANSEVIISNSGSFYSRFVRACQVDIVFSPPIATLKDDVLIEPATHAYNYKGAGVSVVPNGVDPQQMDVTIPGVGGIVPPILVGTGSGSSGNVQVLTLQYTVPSAGTDRGALVQISTEEAVTVVSVDIGGTPAIQLVSLTDVPNNIRQEQWGCAAQPVGTLTVTVTLSAIAYISSGVETFANVDQITPYGAVNSALGTSNSPSVILATTVDYSLVVDGLATALTPILYTVGPGQIENWHETANADTRQGGSSIESAGTAVDNVTMDWSITQNTDWVITVVEVIGLTLPSSSSLEIEDEGVSVETGVTKINFIGAGVTATPGLPNEVDVTVPGVSGAQAAIQFEDEGGNLGTAGTADEVDFTGAGVTASRIGNKVTVNVPGGGGGGTTINLTAEEDLTVGDTVGFTTTIPDEAIKAAWAYREGDAPPAIGGSGGFNKTYSICNIGGDKFAAIYEGHTTGSTRIVVFDLDRTTMTVTFGTPSTSIPSILDGADIAKCDTDKFIVCYAADGVNTALSRLYTVAGLVITQTGVSIALAPGSDYVSMRAINFGVDRIACLYWQPANDSYLVAIDTSGATPVLIDSHNMFGVHVDFRNANLNMTQIDTDKVAVQGGTRAIIMDFAGSVWAAGAITTGLLIGSVQYHSMRSVTTDTFWSTCLSGTNLIIYYFTVIGTNITVEDAYVFTDGTLSGSAGAATLLTDGLAIYMMLYNPSGTNQSGLYSLEWDGSDIIVLPINAFSMSGWTTALITDPSTSVIADKLSTTSDNTYFTLGVGINSSTSATGKAIKYHVQGMTSAYVGVAQASVARGAAVSVQIAGVDVNQTGLISGSLYIPYQGGLLASNDQSSPWKLQAQNTTDIKVD